MSDQFNWIFVIIAGAVILLFFFSMIQKQQSLSIAKTDASIVRQIETLLSVAGSLKETISTKDLPNIDLTFQCKKRGTSCDCTYKSGTMDRSYDDKIIYAPKKITGTQLHLWTHTWEQPFRVANFLYITNDRHQYIIVTNNQPIANDIKKIIPERINVKYVTDLNGLNTVVNPSSESVNVLCISSGQNTCTQIPAIFSNLKIQKSWIIRNSETELLINNANNKFSYIGIPQLLGALFSADMEMFECNTMKSFDRLTSIAEVQEKRITNLNTALASTRQVCSGIYVYQNVATNLGKIKTAANILRTSISSIIASTQIGIIKNAYDPIKITNDKLIVQSCPLIY